MIGSIVDHRAKLPAIQVRALLADLADAVLAADLPDVTDGVAEPRSPARRRERDAEIRSAAE